MDEPTTATTPDEAASLPVVTVRYWAAARAAAGVSEERLSGATLAAVLDEARKAHSSQPRFGSVLTACSFLVGDVPVGSRDPSTVAVQDGDVVEALPPFAGG
jgi:molybdopterin converting factor small subunit